MPMDPLDYHLSMSISRRGRIPAEGLRQLLVNRLSATFKVVGRRSLREIKGGEKFGFFCEECSRWSHEEFFPETWDCDHCGTEYRVELVIYEKVKDGQRVPIE